MNVPLMYNSCTQFSRDGVTIPNNDEGEVTAIKDALFKVSGESGLPAEYLLAIMMQESKGCVRAPTTNYGHDNPGLFQSYEGAASCNRDIHSLVTPCPSATIEDMVREGAGIGRPFGLQQAIEQSGASDDSKYYKGARIYNSGTIATSGNLGDGIATHCYASDVANRLVGWPSDDSHPSACSEAGIQGLAGGNGAYAGTNNDGDVPMGAEPTGQNPNGDLPMAGGSTPKEGSINAPQDVAPENPSAMAAKAETDAPMAAGSAVNCKSWYTVKAGDGCNVLPADFATLRQLNPSINDGCTNLSIGVAYCLSA